MKNLTSIALAMLTTNALVGCVTGDNDMPDDPVVPNPTADRVEFPKTCAERALGNPNAADGEHELYLANQEKYQWTAYCVDMQSDAPKEYLTLPAGGDLNVSRYSAGGMSAGVSVETKFDKIRIDPITLKVDIADLTFATTEGKVIHLGTTEVTSMAFGLAMSCELGNSAHAQIDLQGTPFGIVNWYKHPAGIGHAGMWENGQVIELSAQPDGGDCGWVAPSTLGYDAPLAMSSNWGLALTYR